MNRKLKLEDLNRLSIEEYRSLKKHPIIVVLNNIRSLNNIGSFFRTCDALAIQEIILTGITATPPHREIRKTALGSTESVNWSYQKNCKPLLNEYKNKGYKILAVEQTTDSIFLNEFIYKGTPLILVFGNEVYGVEDDIIELADNCIEIPQYGTKHSFNVSVSGGIVLWHLIKQIL